MNESVMKNYAYRLRMIHNNKLNNMDKRKKIENIILLLYKKSEHIINDFQYMLRNIDDYEKYADVLKEYYFFDEIMDRLAGLADTCDVGLIPGFCDICGTNTNFILDSVWLSHTEGLRCQSCGLNSRLRNIYHYFNLFYVHGMKVYINEETSPFYKILKLRYPDIIGSIFKHDSQYRYEDARQLSFKNKSIDIYLSNDVFEHVFDYQLAFSEAFRILKDGGVFLFHVPFSFRDKTIVRASCDKGGEIKYLYPPIYHGDPVNQNGALWVNDFGFDMLDTLRGSGFSDAYAIICRDTKRCILNHSALVFIAKK